MLANEITGHHLLLFIRNTTGVVSLSTHATFAFVASFLTLVISRIGPYGQMRQLALTNYNNFTQEEDDNLLTSNSGKKAYS